MFEFPLAYYLIWYGIGFVGAATWFLTFRKEINEFKLGDLFTYLWLPVFGPFYTFVVMASLLLFYGWLDKIMDITLWKRK